MSDFLDVSGREPYRSFVAFRVKRLSARELQSASTDEWEMLLGALTGGSPDLGGIGVTAIRVTSALKRKLPMNRDF